MSLQSTGDWRLLAYWSAEIGLIECFPGLCWLLPTKTLGCLHILPQSQTALACGGKMLRQGHCCHRSRPRSAQ